MRIKTTLILVLLVMMLLTGCAEPGTYASGMDTGSDELPTRDAAVTIEWENFTMTNAEGQRLMMDLSTTDFPEGDMQRGDVTPTGSGTDLMISFDIPRSSYYDIECPKQDFYCCVSEGTTLGEGGYVASAGGDCVTGIRLSDTTVSLVGIDSDFRLYLNTGRDLTIEGHTASVVAMTCGENVIIITGLTGEYKFWATDKYHLDSYAIIGTAQTGTITVDLSRLESERIIAITDGDKVTKHEVNKLY